MAKDAIPTIPAVPTTVKDKQLRNFMQSMKDAVQVRAGQTKNTLDYSPTIRELQEIGVLGVKPGQGNVTIITPPDITIPPTDPPPWDYPNIPIAPTGVTVFPTPWFHHVSWDQTSDTNHYIVSHAEVWTSIQNDRDTAYLAGTGMIAYSHPVRPLATQYYWVRYISYANVQGLWSSGVNDGVEGISAPDPAVLLDTLTGAITESELYSVLNTRLDDYGSAITLTENAYFVKINNDGHFAGFGLIVEGEEEYDPLLGHSQFGVAADTFWIGAPGADNFAFIVDAQNNRVVMDGAFIKTATIVGAAIKEAAIDSAHIGVGVIGEAHVETGAITNLKIGDLIRSKTVDFTNGIGWSIDKEGAINASQIGIWGPDGDPILVAGQAGSAYFGPDINNNAQLFADISDIPDHLEYAALLSMPSGGYGDLKLTFDAQAGVARVTGQRFFLPDGSRYTVEAGTQIELFQRAGQSFKAAFVVYFAQTLTTKFPGWQEWSYSNDHMAYCLYDATTQLWYAYDRNHTEYLFTPENTNCIIATTSRNDPAGSDATFNSFIGVDSLLPDDNASNTGHYNLIVDGDFHGLANGMQANDASIGDSIEDNQPFWEPSGDKAYIRWYVQEPYGDIVQFSPRSGSNPLYCRIMPDDPRTITVIPGEPMYAAMKYGLFRREDMTTGGSVFMTFGLLYYDQNDAYITSDHAISVNITWSSNGTQFVTGVLNPPTNAKYGRAQLILDPCNGVGVNIGFLGISRQPQSLGALEAGTYIKDAALGTLQLAGNTVIVVDTQERVQTVTCASNSATARTTVINNSVVLSRFTSTSSILCNYTGYMTINASPSDSSSLYAAGYHTGIRLELLYQVNGGTWVAFWDQNYVAPIVSISMEIDPEDGKPTGYLGSTMANGNLSATALLTPGAFDSSTTINIRMDVIYVGYPGHGTNPLNFTGQHLSLSAGKR